MFAAHELQAAMAHRRGRLLYRGDVGLGPRAGGAWMKEAEPWQLLLVIALFASIYLFIGLGRGWLMRAIQITIMLAIMGSNIRWNWTPNGYLAGMVGIGAAWVLTVPPVLIWDRLRRKPRPPVSRSVVKREQSTELDL